MSLLVFEVTVVELACVACRGTFRVPVLDAGVLARADLLAAAELQQQCNSKTLILIIL